MTRPYNERRNHQIIVLFERRKLAPKDIVDILALKFPLLTYDNVRQIISRWRKCRNLSRNVTTFSQK